ncbi:MAG: oxaloacetate decarboxylase [Rhodospirillaceae bacterium]|nr:oxaloacetate decarboxylase [Rhodospirillaceae bacterium]|tara:strand:- start:8939 stop:9796 length:858 start_codon:yes stop_codon:yes gene_type:complete
MNLSERRNNYRKILEGRICIFPGSVFDPISARIAEELEFECMMFAGSVASQTILGAPDTVVITLTELADQTYRINRSVISTPLMVDADHGYGNVLNVRRTVEELENAGVSGLTIEDTELPLGYGLISSGLISIDEGVAKIRSALDSRQDSRLAIIARTSAAQITDIHDAVLRARRYEEAGADAIFFSGLKNKDDIKFAAGSISIPVMLGGSGSVPLSNEELGVLGVRICLQGHYPFLASIKATYETLKKLRAGTKPEELSDYADNGMVERLMRSSDYETWRKINL